MSASLRAPRRAAVISGLAGLAVLAGFALEPIVWAANPPDAATAERPAVRSGPPVAVGSFLEGGIDYQASWQVNAADGWASETSGDVERFTERDTHLECHAGGDGAGTHYARVRRKLPERDDVAIRTAFSIEATFELPDNFYERHESYMRVITAENTRGKYRSDGRSVGTSSSDEWRVGFAIYGGDRLFRLISDHQNHDNIILWTAPSRLATGRHVVRVDFAPSRSDDGAWAVYVDGQLAGSANGVRTVPKSVPRDDVVITRVGGCIDGASKQDSKSVQVNLFSLDVRARR